MHHSQWPHHSAVRGRSPRVHGRQMSHTEGKFKRMQVQTHLIMKVTRGLHNTQTMLKIHFLGLYSNITRRLWQDLLYQVLEHNPAVQCASVFLPGTDRNRSLITSSIPRQSVNGECRRSNWCEPVVIRTCLAVLQKTPPFMTLSLVAQCWGCRSAGINHGFLTDTEAVWPQRALQTVYS